MGRSSGTLSLGDRPSQPRGWNVPEKYVAYSWRTGNKACSLSFCTSPPFFSLSLLHPEFSCLSFHISVCVSVCASSSPLFSWPLTVSCASSFNSIINSFPPPCMLGELAQHGVEPRLVAGERSLACHLAGNKGKEKVAIICYVAYCLYMIS